MNRVLVVTLLFSCFFVSCKDPKTTETTDEETVEQPVEGRYGDTLWSTADAYDPASFNFLLGDRDSLDAILSGDINSVCQAKGCWMKMDIEGMDVRVKFRDYGYFVPMNSAGHKATVKGTFFIDSVSVDELKEYARDAEKTQEEIDAITDYEIHYSIIADGVVIE